MSLTLQQADRLKGWVKRLRQRIDMTGQTVYDREHLWLLATGRQHGCNPEDWHNLREAFRARCRGAVLAYHESRQPDRRGWYVDLTGVATIERRGRYVRGWMEGSMQEIQQALAAGVPADRIARTPFGEISAGAAVVEVDVLIRPGKRIPLSELKELARAGDGQVKREIEVITKTRRGLLKQTRLLPK